MVGVPGKYKGCETCRRRRVKCTNERPYCSKCTSSGRQCEGYEREMMFITGTPENKGRVSSHPKKGPSASSSSSPSSRPKPRSGGRSSKGSSNEDRSPALIPTQPLTPAWDDFIGLSNNGVESHAMLTALQTPLNTIVKEEDDSEDETGFKVSLFPNTPPHLPIGPGNDKFNINAHCLVNPAVPHDSHDGGNFCAFLFEHSLASSSYPTYLTSDPDQVQLAGPSHFQAFPNHHYFVRVYRPLALSVALLKRRPTFLSEPQWQTTPWETHPKALFDQLLDVIALLPAIFQHADQLSLMQPILSRRHEAQDLLANCLTLESRFDEWLGLADRNTTEQPVSYWAGELSTPHGGIAFSHSYAFKDGMTGLMFLYYWMSQIRFRQCIDSLYQIIFEPVVDTLTNMWATLPPNLQVDFTRYQQTRDLAANICQGLDSTLGHTVQPNMLLAPLSIALELYQSINTATHDCIPEILWLEAFHSKLADKVGHVASVLQGNRWIEVTRF